MNLDLPVLSCYGSFGGFSGDAYARGMQPIRDIALPILVATAYLSSAFFAVAALVPVNIAFSIAAVVMFLALLILLWLRHIGMDMSGAPAGILYFFPVVIVACGLTFWISRFVGLLG